MTRQRRTLTRQKAFSGAQAVVRKARRTVLRFAFSRVPDETEVFGSVLSRRGLVS